MTDEKIAAIKEILGKDEIYAFATFTGADKEQAYVIMRAPLGEIVKLTGAVLAAALVSLQVGPSDVARSLSEVARAVETAFAYDEERRFKQISDIFDSLPEENADEKPHFDA